MTSTTTRARRGIKPPRGSKAFEFERELAEIVQNSVKTVSEKVRQILEQQTGRAAKRGDLSA